MRGVPVACRPHASQLTRRQSELNVLQVHGMVWYGMVPLYPPSLCSVTEGGGVMQRGPIRSLGCIHLGLNRARRKAMFRPSRRSRGIFNELWIAMGMQGCMDDGLVPSVDGREESFPPQRPEDLSPQAQAAYAGSASAAASRVARRRARRAAVTPTRADVASTGVACPCARTMSRTCSTK
jgi:hypothetical protein